MKIHTEDPRLTAFVLGELSPEESAAIQIAAESDPALNKAIQELEEMKISLTESLTLGSIKLLSSQKAEIIEAARQADLAEKIHSGTSFVHARKWLGFAALAATIVIGFFLMIRSGKIDRLTVATEPGPPEKKIAAAKAPAAITTPSETTTPPPSLPGILEQPIQATNNDKSSIELPILATKPNLDKIIQSVRTERALPPHDSIRLENILNSFPIRLNGVTAIARASKQNWHPDGREAGMTTHSATLSTETLACPWKPSATLVLVSIRGNSAGDCEAKVIFHPNSENSASAHLLGYSNADGVVSTKTPTTLRATSATTLAIEVEPRTPKGDLGVIEWSVDGVPAANVTLTRNSGAEPSNDARFAALACAYAKWLAGEQQGSIDKAILSAFTREISSPDLPRDRADFIKLIDESLNL